MAESPRRRREEDDKQKTRKESYITDMSMDAYKVKVPPDHHRHTAQQTTGYKWTLEMRYKEYDR